MKKVYTSPSGKALAKSEFLTYFEKRVRKTIRTNKLIGKKEKILVACSGGKDSTTALYLLKKIIKNKDISIEAVHIDAGIGAFSKINKKNIDIFCKANGIKIHHASFREEFRYPLHSIKNLLMQKGIKWKSCTICGVLRRNLLNKKARELKATKLATGHNLDDEAQAIVMNLTKNTMPVMARLGPVSGVSKQKGFITRIKPLYFSSEYEIKIYSKLMGFNVSYKSCPYRKDAYRKEAAEMLDNLEKKHGQTKYSIVRSLLEILPELKKKYKGDVSYCKKCNEPSSGNLCNACKITEML